MFRGRIDRIQLNKLGFIEQNNKVPSDYANAGGYFSLNCSISPPRFLMRFRLRVTAAAVLATP